MSYCVCGCRWRWFEVSANDRRGRVRGQHKLGLRTALRPEEGAVRNSAERILRDCFWREPDVTRTPTATLHSVSEREPRAISTSPALRVERRRTARG
jgi:hypothetical protein